MINNWVKVWLLLGILMIFMQIFLGGITRLTGSGLSITKWDIVTGAIPPLNQGEWIRTFELYKATPQYQKINQGMDLSEFKFIFFWEYLHRLWARSMGFVFLIPFLFFLLRGWLDRKLRSELLVVVLLAGIVGIFGWIMVASGLVNRPWVNAYKLSLHLGLALITISYLVWVYLDYTQVYKQEHYKVGTRYSKWFLILVCFQILLGGMMSGMKAGLMYPSFPLMNHHLIDPVLFKAESWQLKHFIDYDVYPFMSALVQVLHRCTAVILLFYFVTILVTMSKSFSFSKNNIYSWIAIVLLFQITIGILTLINCKGRIPVGLGIFHQMFAIFLLMSSLVWYYKERKTIP
ncbi:MAG TPA: COX15/CtaA family protein [Bacteroidia bacterium]|nr:COX15/CtaA family protein [Bacteroidia bacterium]